MKKILPYVIMVLVIAAVTVVMIGTQSRRRFDERISLRKKDKIPYGGFVAYESLKYLFPEASILSERREPGYWDSLFITEPGQALLIITPQFMADENELEKLVDFARNGNDVLISTAGLSHAANTAFQCETIGSSLAFPGYSDQFDDTLRLTLMKPPFPDKFSCDYPGRKFDRYFRKYDSSITFVMGVNDNGHANFIRLRTGTGNIYLHLAPLAFSNYFLLHKDNIHYYENALSVISPDVKKILWDEYYLHKLRQQPGGSNNKDREGLLSVLFRYPPLKWGLLTAIFTLLVYVLLEMRRKQQFIPVLSRPRNDSLDFVKTIGRLYYDKKDHANLSRKMASYFLEHVRNRYKIATNELDEAFVKTLYFKSGYDETKLREIISFIQFLNTAPAISDSQLTEFYKQLESFYKTT